VARGRRSGYCQGPGNSLAGRDVELFKDRAGRACSKRLSAHTMGKHFELMHPVSVRFSGLGPVEALVRAVLGLFARPGLGHLVSAGATGPGLEHLPRLPMPGIDRIRLRLLADRLRSYSQRQF
jgi:hypothetical protein